MPAAEVGRRVVGPFGEEIRRVGRDEAFEGEKGQCIIGLNRRVEGICVMGSEEKEERVKEKKPLKKKNKTHV